MDACHKCALVVPLVYFSQYALWSRSTLAILELGRFWMFLRHIPRTELKDLRIGNSHRHHDTAESHGPSPQAEEFIFSRSVTVHN